MRSATDYGFNEGYILEKGTIAPTGYSTIANFNNEEALAVPDEVLDDQKKEFSDILGTSPDQDVFNRSFYAAKNILNISGLSSFPQKGVVSVGTDFKGNPIYSDPKFSNSQSTQLGEQLISSTGIGLGSMGAFKSPEELTDYLSLGTKAASPELQSKLDQLRTAQDPKGFLKEMGQLSKSKDRTDYIGLKVYEAWNSMSPTQKSVALAGTAMHGYTFANGDTFDTKSLVAPVQGVPNMTAAEGLNLATQGINVPPATKRWDQYSAFTETLYSPKKASDVVHAANNIGLLGYGENGAAVPIDENIANQYKMQSAPHYGIGAAMIPLGQQPPAGYTKVRDLTDSQVIVPTSNRNSVAMESPDVASKAAADIYSKWEKDGEVKQDKGVLGGSALAGGLAAMVSTNPYSLGAVTTYANFSNTDVPLDNLGYVTQSAGIALNRLSSGGVSKEIDNKEVPFIAGGELTEKNYGTYMRQVRGEYSKQGIASKEIGYQLANQGFAEGRFNESQVTAIQKTLDMVFDQTGYGLAQKLLTGKNKGTEILESRKEVKDQRVPGSTTKSIAETIASGGAVLGSKPEDVPADIAKGVKETGVFGNDTGNLKVTR